MQLHAHPPRTSTRLSTPLQSTTLHDRWRSILVLDATAARTACLNALHHAHAVLVTIWHLPEDDMAAVEPGGDDGRDEELGAVGVWAGVGHGEEEGLVVLELEVLVGELLAVDGFAARAITTGEVSTLEHELWNDTMELAALVTEALLASAEGTEVLGRLRDDVVEDLEVDAAGAWLVSHVLACHLAASISLELWARPGAVKVRLDRHVAC